MSLKTKNMAKIQSVSTDNLKQFPASSKVSLKEGYAFCQKRTRTSKNKNITYMHIT